MSDVRLELEQLPLSQELLNYYRKRLDKAQQDFAEVLSKLDDVKISHGETHKLHWELNSRMNEIADLQATISDCQTALFEERKQLLKVVAENDELKGEHARFELDVQRLTSNYRSAGIARSTENSISAIHIEDPRRRNDLFSR